MKRWYSLTRQDVNRFIVTCFAQDTFAKQIRCWFEEKECFDSLGPEERARAEKAASSTKGLFKSLAIFFAGGWLQSNFMVKRNCVAFLHYYLSIDEGSTLNDVSATDIKNLVQLSSLSSERIRELATFAGFEETSYWHTLAQILEEADHVDDAVEEFEVAIRMDGHNWWAMWGLGSCCEVMRDFPRTIDWYLRAVKVMPEEEVYWRCCIWSWIGSHLEFLRDTFRYQELIDLVEKFDTQPASVGQGSALTELLHEVDVHEPIAIAARASGRLDFAIDAFEKANALAEKTNDDYTISNQRCLLAKVYYSVADNEDRAIQLWEDVIANSTSHIESVKFAALNSLSEVYFDKARAAESNEANPAVWVSQLQRLSKIPIGPVDSEEDELAREMGNPSLMLGLWYRLHGKQNEARACFRASVLEGIGFLTDEDPYDDVDGYMSLRKCF